jgi:hypothetical protein
VRQDRGDHLRLAAKALGEERSHGPVDEARGEDLLLRRPTLALEEAARDLAGGERLLDVLASEREEIETRALVTAVASTTVSPY